MSTQQSRLEDLLFWSQILVGLVFFVAQGVRMFESTQGIIVSFFFCQGAFAVLNLWLSINALKSAKKELAEERSKKQVVVIYGMWTLIAALHIMNALYNLEDRWKRGDWITALIVAVGVVTILVIMRWSKKTISDPWVKCGLAVFFKSVPQVSLAVTIVMLGKGGVSGLWIILGHVGIVLRLVQLWLSNRKKQDYNTKASFVSEVGNGLTWLIASIAWILS